MIASRAMVGLLNGSVGVIKAMLVEVRFMVVAFAADLGM
jgi:hypothetical protein